MKLFTNRLFLIILLLALAFLDLSVGSISLWDKYTDICTVLLELRLPKTLTAIAAGSILALSGMLLQILFRNPIAGPYVLGISSAASLWAAIGIMFSGVLNSVIWYDIGVSVFAIMGAIMGLLIISLILKITSNITIVLLIGLMLSQLYGAIQSILSYLSTEHALKMYTLWTMGSIQHTSIIQASALLFISIVILVITLYHIKGLTVYITGDNEAWVMGIDIQKMKKQLIMLTAIVIGMLTAYCGPIAFVGMSVPIFVRILNKNANVLKWTEHSCLYGAIFMLITDISNQIIFDGSVPLNILISIWGVPLMIWMLLKQVKLEYN